MNNPEKKVQDKRSSNKRELYNSLSVSLTLSVFYLVFIPQDQ